MGEETAVSGAPTGATATKQNEPSADVLAQMKDELAKVTTRLKEQESFINRQANEIGELRKLTGKADAKASDVAGDKAETKAKENAEKVIETPKEFDFDSLSPTEQDAITVYMREHLGKLEGNDRKIAMDTLRDKKAFNELAKDIHGKMSTPKHLEAILGAEPVQKKPDVKTEVLSELRTILKLVDAEKTATPPSGGASRGTVVSQKPSEAPKRKYPNGGILSLTSDK